MCACCYDNIFLYSYMQGMTTQHTAHDMSSYNNPTSSMGYLPVWQHQYQLPGQEYSVHVSSQNRIQTNAQSDVVRSNSAPPVSCIQDTLSASASSLNLPEVMNVDSPSLLIHSSHFSNCVYNCVYVLKCNEKDNRICV